MVAADTELRRIVEILDAASEPEAVFGVVPGANPDEQLRAARRAYRGLARAVHPDANGGGELASAAFRRLDDLWGRARALIADGAYGQERSPTVVVRTRRREYAVSRKVAVGEFCDLFDCSYDSTRAIFKVARHPRDNDLVQAEARTLRRLAAADPDDRSLPFLPELVDEVAFRAPGGVHRRANVLARLDGFYSLEDVLDAYPAGIDPRDMAWMWRRLLAVLCAAHDAGVIHAAVVPAHVLVHPEKHGLVLADWAYAVERGGRPRAVSRRYRAWYPPELADERRLGPEADVFMGARTMLALVGGSSSVPPLTLPAPMRAFFRACALPERLRPGDAGELLRAFDDVLYRCYGPRRFRPFSMPTPYERSHDGLR